ERRTAGRLSGWRRLTALAKRGKLDWVGPAPGGGGTVCVLVTAGGGHYRCAVRRDSAVDARSVPHPGSGSPAQSLRTAALPRLGPGPLLAVYASDHRRSRGWDGGC